MLVTLHSFLHCQSKTLRDTFFSVHILKNIYLADILKDVRETATFRFTRYCVCSAAD